MLNFNLLKQTVFYFGFTILSFYSTCKASDWKEVQNLKQVYITKIAGYAMEQQKLTSLPGIQINYPSKISDGLKMKVFDRKPNELRIKSTDIFNDQFKPQ